MAVVYVSVLFAAYECLLAAAAAISYCIVNVALTDCSHQLFSVEL